MEKTIHSVLIIEDESLISFNMKAVLEENSYIVCGITSSGAAAIESYEKFLPDAILVDINLKGKMSGIEVCQELIKRGYNPEIFYITGYMDNDIIDSARDTMPRIILEKPVKSEDLLQALNDQDFFC